VEDARQNTALVTQTLVANAGLILTDPTAITLPRFLDLCTLCEAVVLLDHMAALAASHSCASALAGWLEECGLYRVFQPSLSRDDLRRVQMRLPAAFAERSSLDGWADDGDRHADVLIDLRAATGLDDLLARVDHMGGYASAGDARMRDRMYRANGYLVVAAAHGLDYFPDFDRVPFVAGTLRTTYRSLPVQLYEKVTESLEEPLNGGDVVAEWAGLSTIPIPPISALVLSGARSLDDVPGQMLRVRAEFAKYRRHFADFKAELHAADTIRERRKMLRRYQTLLDEASGPRREAVSLTEMLNLTEQAVKVATGPIMPTNYSALLLTQPTDWIRRWWRRRPLAILFRLDSKLPQLSEYRQLVSKLWGEPAGALLLDQAAGYGSRLRTLMADAEASPDQR
jgi:hypothetical protein